MPIWKEILSTLCTPMPNSDRPYTGHHLIYTFLRIAILHFARAYLEEAIMLGVP